MKRSSQSFSLWYHLFSFNLTIICSSYYYYFSSAARGSDASSSSKQADGNVSKVADMSFRMGAGVRWKHDPHTKRSRPQSVCHLCDSPHTHRCMLFQFNVVFQTSEWLIEHYSWWNKKTNSVWIHFLNVCVQRKQAEGDADAGAGERVTATLEFSAGY